MLRRWPLGSKVGGSAWLTLVMRGSGSGRWTGKTLTSPPGTPAARTCPSTTLGTVRLLSRSRPRTRRRSSWPPATGTCPACCPSRRSWWRPSVRGGDSSQAPRQLPLPQLVPPRKPPLRRLDVLMAGKSSQALLVHPQSV